MGSREQMTCHRLELVLICASGCGPGEDMGLVHCVDLTLAVRLPAR